MIVVFAKQDHDRNFNRALYWWASSSINLDNQIACDPTTSLTSNLFCSYHNNSLYVAMIRVKDCFEYIESDIHDGIEGFQMFRMIEMFYIAVFRLQSECKLFL